MKTIFITGSTGYLGARLIRRCLHRGDRVVALVRPGSEAKVPKGAALVIANAFDAKSFAPEIPPNATFVQLLGVPHPSPRKKEQFYQIDLASVKASAEAAALAGVAHFIYVSVAQEPSKIMEEFQHVRALGEQYLLEKSFPCSLVRPWYVVGPGHWWPLLLWPVYKLLEHRLSTRRKALALGLVSLNQMLATLLWAIDHPAEDVVVYDVEQIRSRKPGSIARSIFPV